MPPPNPSTPDPRRRPSASLQLEVALLEGASADGAPLPSRSGALVVIADADADLRAYLRNCLDALGYRVAEAADGAGALALVRGERPVLVIADVWIPGLDGLALRDTLTVEAGLSDVPVLLMTSDPEAVRGVAPCLPKPFHTRLLREHLETLLAGSTSSETPVWASTPPRRPRS